MKKSYIFLSICLSSSFCSVSQAQDRLAGESTEWRLELTGESRCENCPGGGRYTVSSTSKNGKPNHELVLETMAESVSYLSVYKSLALIKGKLPHGGDSIALFDLNTGRKLLELYGYTPQISPSGRYILFKHFYPRITPNPESTVMLFDLEFAISGSMKVFDGIGNVDIGFPVHPTQNSLLNGGQLPYQGIPADYPLAQVSWLEEDNRVMFPVLDESGYQNILSLKLSSDDKSLTNPAQCYIPFAPRFNESVNAEHWLNVVETIEILAEGQMEVKMVDRDGIGASYRINYLSFCP